MSKCKTKISCSWTWCRSTCWVLRHRSWFPSWSCVITLDIPLKMWSWSCSPSFGLIPLFLLLLRSGDIGKRFLMRLINSNNKQFLLKWPNCHFFKFLVYCTLRKTCCTIFQFLRQKFQNTVSVAVSWYLNQKLKNWFVIELSRSGSNSSYFTDVPPNTVV